MTSHVLITSLGTSPRQLTYVLGDREDKGSIAPGALLRLLHTTKQGVPDRALVLTTEEARAETLPSFRAEALALGIPVADVAVPFSNDAASFGRVLSDVATRLPGGPCSISIDLTAGPRPFAFLGQALVFYLQHLRGLQVEHVWYALEDRGSRKAKYEDLHFVFDMADAYFAVRIFRDSGDPGDFARLTERWRQRLDARRAAGDRSVDPEKSLLQRLTLQLERAGDLYRLGPPLEQGESFAQLAETLETCNLELLSARLPAAQDLFAEMVRMSREVATGSPGRTVTGKEEVLLEESELRRQLGLARRYFEARRWPQLYGLLREWIVSLAIFKDQKPEAGWLEKGVRRKAERRVSALARSWENNLVGPLTESQQSLARVWNQVSDVRNKLLHSGMRREVVGVPKPDAGLFDELQQLLAGDFTAHFGGGSGCLLVAPLGVRTGRGALFSALRMAEPDTLCVLCSEESQNLVADIVRAAEYSGPVDRFILPDPFSGVADVKRLVSDIRKRLASADEVIISLTGGTTLMTCTMQQIAHVSRLLHRPTRRRILLDRRSPAEQEKDPYVASDWIDWDTEFADGEEDCA